MTSAVTQRVTCRPGQPGASASRSSVDARARRNTVIKRLLGRHGAEQLIGEKQREVALCEREVDLGLRGNNCKQ